MWLLIPVRYLPVGAILQELLLPRDTVVGWMLYVRACDLHRFPVSFQHLQHNLSETGAITFSPSYQLRSPLSFRGYLTTLPLPLLVHQVSNFPTAAPTLDLTKVRLKSCNTERQERLAVQFPLEQVSHGKRLPNCSKHAHGPNLPGTAQALIRL